MDQRRGSVDVQPLEAFGDSGVSTADIKLARTSSFKKPKSPRIIKPVMDLSEDSMDSDVFVLEQPGDGGFHTPPLSPLSRNNSLLSPSLDRLPRSKSLNAVSRSARRKSPAGDSDDGIGIRNETSVKNLLETQAFKKILEEKEALEEELDRWRKKYESSSGNIEYLYQMEDASSTAIQELKDQNTELKRRLLQKDKEIADMTSLTKTADEALSVFVKQKEDWAAREQTLQKSLASVKSEKQALEDLVAQTEANVKALQGQINAAKNKENALIVMVKTLEEHLQMSKKELEALETQAEVMNRERQGRVIDDPDNLVEQIHRQDIEIEALKEQLNNERISWGKISNKVSQMRDTDVSKPHIPPRISSAVELVHQIPDGAGSLEVEMLKSRVVDSLMNEIKELRHQNLLIITNFVATLDNVTNMAAI
ncbi:hypothetical protein HDU67_010166 [Dinochytrium kinnereticum]|nr:hypothetical protein HDU67_010166 [Dinochytrium kinnereticum]